jgi:hypothetical protein
MASETVTGAYAAPTDVDVSSSLHLSVAHRLFDNVRRLVEKDVIARMHAASPLRAFPLTSLTAPAARPSTGLQSTTSPT